MRAAIALSLFLLAGCAAPAEPQVDRALRLDVYERVAPLAVAPHAGPDAMCSDRECALERIFGDARTFAFVMPWLPGLRGAQGNGPILLYGWNGAGWEFAQELDGCAYEVVADGEHPEVVTYWHMSAYEASVRRYRWEKGAFVATGPAATEDWRGAGD